MIYHYNIVEMFSIAELINVHVNTVMKTDPEVFFTLTVRRKSILND